MSKVEFLIVFVSIILGFNISEYLKGLGRTIKHRKELKSYLPHTLWQILILVMLIQWWWAFWLYSDHVQENMGFFILMIAIPMIYFMSIIFLFPSENDIKQYAGSQVDFFHANSKFLYISVALLFAIYIVTGLVFMDEGFLSRKVILRSLVILSCLVAGFTKTRRTDYLALLITSLVMTYFVWVRF